jgi:hypothetical protein
MISFLFKKMITNLYLAKATPLTNNHTQKMMMNKKPTIASYKAPRFEEK